MEQELDLTTVSDTGAKDEGEWKRKEPGRFARWFEPFVGRNWSWLLAVVLVFIFMVIVAVIMSVAPFGGNSFSAIDSMHQYVPFFSEYQMKLRGGESLFYTWDVGMGQNFLSLFMYYIASPLNLILVFFTRKGIFSAFTFLLIFKMCFTAGAFGYWLSRRRPGKPSNNALITAFSLAFTLSNYMIGYNWNVMWLDCIMMLPLAILGMERIFRDESPKMYILSMFYILYVNYYIAFIICIFVVLWFFAHKQGSFKRLLVKGFSVLGYSLLAGCMAAVGLLTAYMGIMQTASAGKGFPKWGWYGSFFNLLKQHFFLTEPIDTQSFDGGLNAYCGTFAVMLFFLFLFSNRISKGEAIRKLLLLAVLIFSFNSTVLNFVWHGFHDQYGIPNRFSFVYVFTLLTVGYEALIRIRQTKSWCLILSGILSLVFYYFSYSQGKPSGILAGKYMVWITFGLVTVYLFFFWIRQKGVMKLRTTGIILASIMIVEVATNAALGYYKIDVANGAYYTQYVEEMTNAKEAMDQREEEQGILFTRSDLAMPRMLDEATYFNLRSMGTFCSTVGGNLVKTMGRLGCYEGANEFLFYGGNPVLNTLTGMRYTYVREKEYAGIASREVPVYDDGVVRVYENPYVLPIAYMTSEEIVNWKADQGFRADAVNALATALTGVEDVYDTHMPVITASGENVRTWTSENRPHVINFEADDSGKQMKVTGTFTVKQAGIHLMDTRQNGVKKVRYRKNGVEMGHDRYQAQLFDLGYLNVGDVVEITFEFNTDADKSGTVSIYDYTANEDAFMRMYNTLAEQGMEVTFARDGKLDGRVTAKEDGILFTTIAYDKGWSVEVDGKKAETFATSDTFLAIRLTAGTHEIRFRYTAPGFFPGLLLSLAAWAFFLFLCHVWKKRRIAAEKTERALAYAAAGDGEGAGTEGEAEKVGSESAEGDTEGTGSEGEGPENVEGDEPETETPEVEAIQRPRDSGY